MRITYILGGALIGGLLCYAAFFTVGVMFGPFYDGEADMARNVRIFLLAEVLLVLVGGFVGGTMYNKRKKH